MEEERRQEAEERVSRCRSRGEGAQVLRKRQEAAQVALQLLLHVFFDFFNLVILL